MEFYIDQIILWPKDAQKEPRKIFFKKGKVNVITGDSERGKSALIEIVDYALCSSRCQIPVGIRKYVEWFGVLFHLEGRQLLLARKEPGVHHASGDMFKHELQVIDNIPDVISKTHNVDQVKFRLNELAGLSDIALGVDSDNITGFNSRPSFRDLVSFLFQPQYIIANQRTLFYKTDSYEHREKIRNIFPYVLRAINNETLRNKERLKELRKEEKALEKELENVRKGIERWLGEIRGFYMQAKEFGLLSKRPEPELDWKPQEFIKFLSQIPGAIDKQGVPMMALGSTSKITDRISELMDEEIKLSKEIEKLRSKQSIVKRISTTNSYYTESVLTQHERLKSVGWFNKRLQHDHNCPVCGSHSDKPKAYLKSLLRVSGELEKKAANANDTRVIFDAEIAKIDRELKRFELGINDVRQELKRLLREDEKYKKSSQSVHSIYRFVGELESKLESYMVLTEDSDLYQKLSQLSNEIVDLEKRVDESLIKEKERNALVRIQKSISHYAEIFEAERSDDPISLNTTDLTLNFGSDSGRVDALWDIGSGSNYMAYHVSALIALHELFLRSNDHPVPTFLFFDQPSQAYFPEMILKNEEQISAAKQEDLLRVKRIFKALASAITRTNGKLQIIVLEHAGPGIWQDFPEVHKVARWRDDEEEKALIPESWMN